MATVVALQTAGIHAIAVPLLEVTPYADGDQHYVLLGLSRSAVDGIIFVSANAAEYGVPLLRARSNLDESKAVIYAVGRATRAALEAQGLCNIIVPPDGEDSEALLRLPQFQRMNGHLMVLVKGQSESGGRPLIARTLEARGADVRELLCYERRPIFLGVDEREALHQAIMAGASVLVGSVETLDALTANLKLGALEVVSRLLVPHRRVAEAAQRLGATRVEVVSLENNALIDYLKTRLRSASE